MFVSLSKLALNRYFQKPCLGISDGIRVSESKFFTKVFCSGAAFATMPAHVSAKGTPGGRRLSENRRLLRKY
jgi:hypothetical protein